MNNFNDIKQLWHKQPVNLPDVQEIIDRARGFQNKMKRSIIIQNTFLAATCAFITGILIYFKPAYLTTKIGVLLAVVGMIMSIILQNRNLQLLFQRKGEDDNDSQHYLQKMLDFRSRQLDFQNKVMSIYFVLLAVGIGLYMIEYAMRMQLVYAILCYVVTAAWIAFNWFYIRPKQIKKQRMKMDVVINDLKKIQHQLTEN